MTDAQIALRDYMSDLSEEAYFAGWMMGLEYALWEILQNPTRRHYGVVEFTSEQVDKLRGLHEACGGWIYWKGEPGDPDSGETFATTEEWLAMRKGAR